MKREAQNSVIPAIPMFQTPTPEQVTRSIQTPFGLAWFNDLRQPGEQTLGRVGFEKPTINGKTYTEDVHMYLESRPHGASARTMWFGARYSPNLTGNAWHKLHAWLHENRHEFDALRAPLTAEVVAKMRKEKADEAVRAALRSVSVQGFSDDLIAGAVEMRLKSYRHGMSFAL